jgi:L-ascorbate metabolism protein UlaG (beta-lactamase superfamily)
MRGTSTLTDLRRQANLILRRHSGVFAFGLMPGEAKMSIVRRAGVLFLLIGGALLCGAAGLAQEEGEPVMMQEDTIQTSAGELKITFVGHATLMFAFGGMVVHVDPVSREADYSTMPKADVILVTHEHGDHLDPKAIEQIRKEGTVILLTEKCAPSAPGATVMKNGDVKEVKGLTVKAVPAYNVMHKRPTGEPFHPRGEGNGYVITFGDKRVYVAGDTENIPEMKELAGVDIAFIPMNLPYTMTPEMAADAARMIRPKMLYPYHFGQTDTSELAKLLADEKEIEVRIRKME